MARILDGIANESITFHEPDSSLDLDDAFQRILLFFSSLGQGK